MVRWWWPTTATSSMPFNCANRQRIAWGCEFYNYHRHRSGGAPVGQRPGRDVGGAAVLRYAHHAGRILIVHPYARLADRGPRSTGHPAVVSRPSRRRLGGGLRNVRSGSHAGRIRTRTGTGEVLVVDHSGITSEVFSGSARRGRALAFSSGFTSLARIASWTAN